MPSYSLLWTYVQSRSDDDIHRPQRCVNRNVHRVVAGWTCRAEHMTTGAFIELTTGLTAAPLKIHSFLLWARERREVQRDTGRFNITSFVCLRSRLKSCLLARVDDSSTRTCHLNDLKLPHLLMQVHLPNLPRHSSYYSTPSLCHSQPPRPPRGPRRSARRPTSE